MAQIAINNNASKTTHITPFYANFGKDPNLFMEALTGLQTDRALQLLANLYDIYDKMRQAISTSQAALTSQRHKDSKTAP